MLQILEIPLTFPGGHHVHSSMGSVFQGALMERLGNEAAEWFHRNEMHSYCQAVYEDKRTHQAMWKIGLLNPYACKVIGNALVPDSQIYLKQQGYAVHLGQPQIRQLDPEILLRQQPPAKMKVTFMTVTSFKRRGIHMLFPELDLIYQSVIRRWPLFSDIPLETGTAQILDYYTAIQGYNLHTERFQLEGNSVPGFCGTIILGLGGTRQIRMLAATLLQCAEYTGIGVKTAMGMGAVQTEKL